MTPAARPEVTALERDVERALERLHRHARRWEDAAAFCGGEAIRALTPRRQVLDAVIPAKRAGSKALDTLAVRIVADALEAQARRLTEQDAEIARLRSRLHWFEAAGGVTMATRVPQEIARANAAEHALPAGSGTRHRRCGWSTKKTAT